MSLTKSTGHCHKPLFSRQIRMFLDLKCGLLQLALILFAGFVCDLKLKAAQCNDQILNLGII